MLFVASDPLGVGMGPQFKPLQRQLEVSGASSACSL